MKSLPKVFLLTTICLLLSSCVTTREQMNESKSDSVSNEPQGTSNDVKSEDLRARPKPTPEVMQSTPTVAPPATAPTAATPAPTPLPDISSYSDDELRAEVARLSGKVEEDAHSKQVDDQAHADELKKYQDRLAELEKKLKELQPDAPSVPEGKTPLEAGRDAFQAGKCDEAIPFLSQTLEKSASGKEAEEATYKRGQCYFNKSQYNKAIVDFSRFPEKYQKSPYHPKALLGIAESFEAMGRKDDAKAFYSDLVDKFPKTAEGKLAKKRLKGKK